jgi:hypothetical protein
MLREEGGKEPHRKFQAGARLTFMSREDLVRLVAVRLDRVDDVAGEGAGLASFYPLDCAIRGAKGDLGAVLQGGFHAANGRKGGSFGNFV